MGQITSISPKGIIRNTPDSSSVDGSLLEAINVRYRDGAWRGVGEKVATGWHADTLNILDGIMYHPVIPANTYVVHNTTDNNIYTILFANGGAAQATTLVLTLAGGEVFNRFSHLGNVLLVFTNLTKYILYWDKITLTYKDLTFLPVPVVNVGDVERVTIDLTTSITDPDPVPDYGLGAMNLHEYFRLQFEGELLKSKANKRTDNLVDGFVCIRLAYRLFDGSYILHSQPYIYNVGYNYLVPYFRIAGAPLSLPYDYWARDFVVAKLAVYYNFFNTGAFSLPDYSALGVIESLDVFCSRPISAFDIGQQISEWDTSSLPECYPPAQSDIIKGILDENLYKVHSIAINDIIQARIRPGETTPYFIAKAGVAYPDMRKEVSLNELMPPDNFSHHTINALCDYQYNSRLHMGEINTKVSTGFNTLYHSWMLHPTLVLDVGGNYIGYDQAEIIPYATTGTKFFGLHHTPIGIGHSTYKIYQQVWIKTEEGRKVITSEVEKSFVDSYTAKYFPDTFKYYGHYYNDTTDFFALIFNPIISYPDYRAYKIRYYYTIGSGATKHFLVDFALKASIGNNIGYYLPELGINNGTTGMFYPNVIAIPQDLTAGLTMPTDSPTDDTVIHDTNRMQVSEIFNPFIWPALNSYRFGLSHNELIDISTVQSQMSDSAFGRYPLYVFSKSGIYTLEHGSGEVLYQSIQPLNNEILLSRGALCAISGSIVFACKEGIRIISGSQVEELSIPAEGSITNPLAGNAHFYDALTGLRLPVINNFRTDVSFLTYIQAAKIFYDVENKEIIISNPAHNYSYIYSLFTQSWATRTDVFTDVITVSGRHIAVKRAETMDGDDLVYVSSLHYLDTEDGTTGLCDYFLMQTRPLNFAGSSFKHLNKVISRCRLTTKYQENAVQIVAGSNDLISWQVVSYVQYSGDNVNMINNSVMGNFKYFIIALAGERKGFALNQIDCDWKERFTGKLR